VIEKLMVPIPHNNIIFPIKPTTGMLVSEQCDQPPQIIMLSGFCGREAKFLLTYTCLFYKIGWYNFD
jgi:hypothetical protein